MSKASDFYVRIPESADPTAPLVVAEAVDLTSLDDNSQVAGTRNYVGVGRHARLHSISEAVPQASSLALRGPLEDLQDYATELRNAACPFPMQLVRICDNRVQEGEQIRQVRFYAQSRPNQPTARGINVTDNPAELTQAGEWEGPTVPFAGPNGSRPAFIDGSLGYYYQAPEGIIDGDNTVFTLDPVPVGDIIVLLDGVVQTTPAEYSLDNDRLTFVAAPDCGEVVLVFWASAEAEVAVLDTVKVVYGSSTPCGGCEGECKYVYVLFQGYQASATGCFTGDSFIAVLAKYRINSDGSYTLLHVRDFAGIEQPHDLLVDGDTVIIAAENGIFRSNAGIDVVDGTGDFVTAVVNGASTEFRKLAMAIAGSSTHYYCLFEDNGILYSKNGRVWNAVVNDGDLTTQVQNDLVAAGDLVATVGNANTIQLSEAAGRTGSWSLDGADVASTFDLEEAALALYDMTSHDKGLLYVLANNGTEGKILISGDMALTWEERYEFTAPTSVVNLSDALDGGWLYMQDGAEVWRNVNKAVDGEWEDISPLSLTYTEGQMAVCPDNPKHLVVVSPQLSVKDDFTGGVALITAHTPDYDALGNGWESGGGTEPGLDGAGVLAFTGNDEAIIDLESPDAIIDVLLMPGAAATAGVVVRFTDGDNYTEIQVDPVADQLEINEIVATVSTNKATEAVTIDGTEWHHLRVIARGQVIRAILDGTTIAEWGLSLTTGEKHGVVGANGGEFDNFRAIAL